MNLVETPQSRCLAGMSRGDITPPVGIYHRMWGAALHDRATGVHRPLEATILWLASARGNPADVQVLIGLDHCILDTQELIGIREGVAAATGITPKQVSVALSHTHGSGWMSRSRSHLPGGDLIGPYLDALKERLVALAMDARQAVVPASIVYGQGRCDLAAHRDYRDPESGRFVCGFNPAGQADDTLLIARLTREDGTTLGTVVNYACHPTTLAWENTLISPDWVGAMREVIERELCAPCLFLQGASGELGPREGFVGDTAVADRNGRQVGYAAMSALTALPPPRTRYEYAGPVVSGATLGIWKHLPGENEQASTWKWRTLTVPLPYRHDLPTVEETTRERDHWLAEEAMAREQGDTARLRDCRAQVEQRTRQLTRLSALVPGRTYPFTMQVGRIGDALWVFTPGELYQVFQTTLRARLAPHPVVVTTLTNDWQPGYVPPASSFGFGIYQEIIAATSPGALEVLIERVAEALSELLRD